MTESLIVGIVIFTLATFLGFELIHRVPPTLHTPLMSGSNAISGVILVGAVLVSANTAPNGIGASASFNATRAPGIGAPASVT